MDKEQEDYIVKFISNVFIESSKLIMHRAYEHQQAGRMCLFDASEITPLVKQATINAKVKMNSEVNNE